MLVAPTFYGITHKVLKPSLSRVIVSWLISQMLQLRAAFAGKVKDGPREVGYTSIFWPYPH